MLFERPEKHRVQNRNRPTQTHHRRRIAVRIQKPRAERANASSERESELSDSDCLLTDGFWHRFGAHWHGYATSYAWAAGDKQMTDRK